jgi:hypothetical protein
VKSEAGNVMNTNPERFGLGIILAPLTPLALFMGAWWGAYEFLPEKWVPLGALSGLLLGLLADTFLLKRLIDRAHQLNMAVWVAVFLFYSIGVFGFFMGVPVFNALLAIPAGFVIGGKLASQGADTLQVRRAAGRTARFTTGVLVCICAASAFIALMSESTASDLRGMLGLGFEVTHGMIVGLILVGGAALLILDWGLAIFSVRFSYKFLQRKV